MNLARKNIKKKKLIKLQKNIKRKTNLKKDFSNFNNRRSRRAKKFLKNLNTLLLIKFMNNPLLLPIQMTRKFLINLNALMTPKRRHTSKRSWEIRNLEQNYASEPHKMAKHMQTSTEWLMVRRQLWVFSRLKRMTSVSEVLPLLSGHHRNQLPPWTTALPCSLTWPLTSYSSPNITQELSDATKDGDHILEMQS